MKKKICALILSISMLSAGISVNAFAADEFNSFSTDETEVVTETIPDDDTAETVSDNSTVSVTPIPTIIPDNTVPTPTPEPNLSDSSNTGTDSQPDQSTPVTFSLKSVNGSLKWKNHTTLYLTMTVTDACKWYYFYANAGTSTDALKRMYDSKKATNVMSSGGRFDVEAQNVPEQDSWLVLCAKPDSGATAKMQIINLSGTSVKAHRPPAVSTPSTPSRKPVIYNVSDSFVSGLEKPLKFYPNKFYDFKVTGAGMTNTNPVAGDIRWYPLYWSTQQVPRQMQQNTTWKIGSAKGITKAKTYNLYIFLKKQIYDGKKWTDPNPEMEEIEYITTTFQAASIPKTVKTKSISGLKKKVTVSKGKTLKLKPVLSPKNSTEKVSYSSSNPKAATVSSKGVIKGIKAGTTKITVKSGSKKVVVTVTVPKTATKKISGVKSKLTMKKGKTSKLTPKLSPSNSDDKISYSSSNKKVATVSSKGIISAQKKGTTTITIKSGKKTVRCKVTVK